MKTYDTLTLALDDGLATLTLNCPEKRNALSPHTLKELINACEALNANDGVRTVLIEGAGKAFSVGFDLRSFTDLMQGDGLEPEAILKESALLGAKAIEAIQNLNAISIASVHGYVIGGGFLMMAACDFRIAEEGTIFSLPEVDIGIPLLWGGVPLLVEHLGESLAKDLVLRARRFDLDVFKNSHFIYRRATAEKRQEINSNLILDLKKKPALTLKQSKKQFIAARRQNGHAQGMDTELFLEAVMNPEFIPTAMAYMQRLKKKD